jgi:hypothetical protein
MRAKINARNAERFEFFDGAPAGSATFLILAFLRGSSWV